MKESLALIPGSRRVAIVAVALLFFGGSYGIGYWKGRNAGYESADNKGKAAIAELQAEHERAYAEEVDRLQEKLRKQTATALDAANTLAKERKKNAATQNDLRRRIARAASGSAHTFSPAFVRVWNEATGAAFAGDCPAVATGNTAAADGKAGAGKTAGAGIRAVTEADILEYITYYGGRTKDLEAQVNAWIDIAGGDGWHEPK